MTLHSLTRVCEVGIRAAVIATTVGAAPLAAAATDPIRIPRVRANADPLITALLQEALGRSATFRRLVDTIDATDGLVYLQRGECGHGVRACLAMTVTIAGPNRMLRIVVNTVKRDREELIASIGHELQHAVEALSDPHVTDYHTIYSFFARIGPTGEDRFETKAAIRAGLDVLGELRAKSR